jgi:uncharacterized membrane protein YhfC
LIGVLPAVTIIVAALAQGGSHVSVIHIISPLLMICIPIALWIVLSRAFKHSWRLFLIGAFTFIISQVFHLPFNGLVLNPLVVEKGWEMLPGSTDLAIISVIFGLSAGLFENITRYLVLRFRLKDARDWERGVMFGAGHGGGEAIILGILSLVTLFQILSLSGTDLSTSLPADQVEGIQAQIDAYWSTPWYLFLLAPLERIGAICLHICATLLVTRSLNRHNPAWLAAAVLLHASMDAFAVFASTTWGPVLAEVGIILIALACLGIILYLRRSMPPPANSNAPEIPNASAPIIDATSSDVLTPEQIEESRFG